MKHTVMTEMASTYFKSAAAEVAEKSMEGAMQFFKVAQPDAAMTREAFFDLTSKLAVAKVTASPRPIPAPTQQ